MKPLILLCCIFTGANAGAKDYMDYYRDVNKAEYCLVNGKPDSVFFYYDRAFSQYDYVFAADAFIAAQFAWKLKNSEKTIDYLLKGAASGLRSSCLEQSPILMDFESTRAYEQVYYGMKQANAKFMAGINRDLREDWIARAGQQVLIAGDEDGDYMREVDKNVKKIKELLALNTYPGEMLVGLNDICTDMGNYNAYNALSHYPCVMSELHDPLWNAVRNGQLHPRDFAALWETQFDKKDCPALKQGTGQFNLKGDMNNVPADQVNKMRAKYFIVGLETDQKKKELEKTEGYRFFFGHR